MRRSASLILPTMFALLLTACADDASAPHATPAPAYEVQVADTECGFKFPQGLDPARVRCGSISVPEDRSRPTGRRLALAFAVLETAAPEPADPLLVLDGGPGASTLQGLMQWFTRSFSEPLLSQRSLVFFDYRGSGLSEPDMSCPELDALGGAPSQAAARDALLACRQRIVDEGADLGQYHSAALAADAADLMPALGFDRYAIYGVSYGTRVALTMLRQHPAGITAAILDSVYPPQVDLYAGLVLHQQQALDRAIEACAADAACDGAYPDLERRLYELVARAGESPLSVPYTNVITGARETAAVDNRMLLGAFFRTVYDTALLPSLPGLVAEIEQADYGTLAAIIAPQVSGGPTGAAPLRSTILGAEEIPFASDDALTDATAQLRPEVAATGINVIDPAALEEERDFAEEWGVQPRPGEESAPVSSDVPVLLLAGEFDPTTPPAWAALAAETLPASEVVELRALGHSVLFQRLTRCPMQLAAAFLEQPGDGLDTTCSGELAIRWILP